MRHATRTLIALLATSAVLVGCGGSDDPDGSGDGGGGSATASLMHVDGVVTLEGDTLTVAPKDGGEPRTFSLGPAVQKAEVLAVSASGAPARVTYRDGEDVAAAVTPAPKVGEGVESIEGDVVSITADTLVITTDDGERSFDITAADAGAFDVEHLSDHKDADEAIRVYFRTDAPDAGVAYEDA